MAATVRNLSTTGARGVAGVTQEVDLGVATPFVAWAGLTFFDPAGGGITGPAFVAADIALVDGLSVGTVFQDSVLAGFNTVRTGGFSGTGRRILFRMRNLGGGINVAGATFVLITNP